MATFTGLAPTLVVPDVEATATWFEELLGFTTWSQVQAHGPGDDDVPEGPDHVHTGPVTFAFTGKDGLSIMLRRSLDGQAHPNLTFSDFALDCYLWVTGVDELFERCRERATIVEPLAEQLYGMRDFTIRSPDGHVLCFGEPLLLKESRPSVAAGGV